MFTLISAMQYESKKNGVAAVCFGGGEAVAMAVELFELVGVYLGCK
ncbi:hypothetical protein [Saccharophagus degradans]|uniref:Uncharacterized protein n=1 Tax=Saccharophagus degradans TaxID=86304 RepID=A0AAW7XFB9_9GAMM|nr:hypothetical protein [Saccharophagus degradans]MDO6425218.1 hypothetical protein [Saccharophagus degradans]